MSRAGSRRELVSCSSVRAAAVGAERPSRVRCAALPEESRGSPAPRAAAVRSGRPAGQRGAEDGQTPLRLA